MENNKDSSQTEWPEYLEAWFGGEADDETRVFVEQWRQKSTQNQLVFAAFEKAFQAGQPAWAKHISVDGHWAELHEQIKAAEPVLWVEQEEKKRGNTLRNLMIAAVSIAATLLLVLNFWKNPEQVYMVESGAGQRLVWLPDSSKVMLNKESKITYQEGFGKTHREVDFEGQGFFEVEPNKALPFKIKSQRSLTQVVGTSFDLQAYPQRDKEGLAVLTGVVNYQPDGAEKGLVVSAGESIEFVDASKVMTRRAGHFNEQLLWSGRFSFQQERLSDVLALLSKYYQTEIKLSDKDAGHCQLTASFTQDSIEEVLDVISFSLQMKWSKKENQYVLSGNSCKSE